MEFTLTRSQARQFIVLWQGLSGPYRWRTNAEIVGLVHQLGCLQFDPIDICGRNADLVLQARVGGYRKSQLETLLDVYKRQEEDGVHILSIAPAASPSVMYQLIAPGWFCIASAR